MDLWNLYIGIYLKTGIYRGVKGSWLAACTVFKLYDPVVRGSCSLPCRTRKGFFSTLMQSLLSAGFWGGGSFWLLLKLWRLTGCCPSILGLFIELNSRKHSMCFTYNLRVKPAARLWAGREFWIRLAGVVFIPSLPGIFIEEIPCCHRDTWQCFDLSSTVPTAR